MTVRRVSTSDRRRPRGPSRKTLIKDVVTFVSGWALIWQQALSGKEPSWAILLLVAVLLGIPGASEVFTRALGGMASSASGSPSEPSSDSSPSISSGGENAPE